MIYGYCRLSTVEQSRGQTLEAQIALLQEWGVDKVYHDLESGRKTDRQQFNQMLNDARALASQGESVTIRVARHDRWARNVVYSLQTIEELESLGVTLEARDRGRITLQTAIDWQITASEAVAAEMESRRISERVRRGIAYKRETNKPLSNVPPFGYRHKSDKTGLEPNTAEWGASGLSVWELARLTIDKILDGASLYQTSIWLFDQYGKKLSSQGVKGWIHNPTLRGHLWYYSLPRDPKSRKIIIPNQHMPLISEDEYGMLQYALSVYASYRGTNRRKQIHALPTSFIFCGHCQRRMVVAQSTGRSGKWSRRYIRCRKSDCESRKWSRNSVRQEKIEAAIQEAIAERADDLIRDLTTPDDDAPDPNIAIKELELEELRLLYRRSQRESLNLAIAEIEAEIEMMKSPSRDQEIDIEVLKQFRQLDFWSEMIPEERRKAYLETVRRIEIHRQRISLLELSF